MHLGLAGVGLKNFHKSYIAYPNAWRSIEVWLDLKGSFEITRLYRTPIKINKSVIVHDFRELTEIALTFRTHIA